MTRAIKTTPERAPEIIERYAQFESTLLLVMFTLAFTLAIVAATLVPVDFSNPASVTGAALVSVMFAWVFRTVHATVNGRWLDHMNEAEAREIAVASAPPAPRLRGRPDPTPQDEGNPVLQAVRQSERMWPFDGSMSIDREGR